VCLFKCPICWQPRKPKVRFGGGHDDQEDDEGGEAEKDSRSMYKALARQLAAAPAPAPAPAGAYSRRCFMRLYIKRLPLQVPAMLLRRPPPPFGVRLPPPPRETTPVAHCRWRHTTLAFLRPGFPPPPRPFVGPQPPAVISAGPVLQAPPALNRCTTVYCSLLQW